MVIEKQFLCLPANKEVSARYCNKFPKTRMMIKSCLSLCTQWEYEYRYKANHIYKVGSKRLHTKYSSCPCVHVVPCVCMNISGWWCAINALPDSLSSDSGLEVQESYQWEKFNVSTQLQIQLSTILLHTTPQCSDRYVVA